MDDMTAEERTADQLSQMLSRRRLQEGVAALAAETSADSAGEGV